MRTPKQGDCCLDHDLFDFFWSVLGVQASMNSADVDRSVKLSVKGIAMPADSLVDDESQQKVIIHFT